jgi:dTDP-L-rhamnose 4-epimerase
LLNPGVSPHYRTGRLGPRSTIETVGERSVLVLVTGGAGFIGSHLVTALAARGHQVRVLDSLEPQVHRISSPKLPDGVELIRGDLRDRKAVAQALRGVEAVLHEAAVVGVGQSMYQIERYVSANSFGTAVLLDQVAHQAQRPTKLIVASSMAIYGEGAYSCEKCGPCDAGPRSTVQLERREWEPWCATCRTTLKAVPTPEEKSLVPASVYAITKRDHEELFRVVGRAYGIPTVALRYFNVYGPGQALGNPYTGVAAIFSTRLLAGGRPVVFEDGRQTRDFVHVSDVVQANLLALEQPDADGIYNVGTGRAISVAQLARLLASLLKPGTEPEIVGQFRAGDVRHCVARIERIQQDLGYRPRIMLEEGLLDLVTWVRTQGTQDAFDAAHAELAGRGLTG